MKRIQSPWVITILSILISVIIYQTITFFLPMFFNIIGLAITVTVPAVVAYPISHVMMSYLKKIEQQKKEIETSQYKMNQSITYASRIQNALFPSVSLFEKNFASYMKFFKPRELVSGDFYYYTETKSSSIIAVSDCTGHGVPGAFVSMLGIAFLNEIVADNQITNAAQILNKLREKVKTSLKQAEQGSKSRDGMDIAICIIDKETKKLSFSGANNPLYFFREGNFTEIKATANPVGWYHKESDFKNNEIQLQTGDKLYMFTDGYMDQFGGEQGFKFKKKEFRKLLTEIHTEPFTTQYEILNDTLAGWRGDKYAQTDDILLIGIEV